MSRGNGTTSVSRELASSSQYIVQTEAVFKSHSHANGITTSAKANGHAQDKSDWAFDEDIANCDISGSSHSFLEFLTSPLAQQRFDGQAFEYPPIGDTSIETLLTLAVPTEELTNPGERDVSLRNVMLLPMKG